ncbi:hypothetical protein CD351_01755 [Erythrobacter sp. KY5]|uniref:hypothetical protein n=1 Tax=Erythrobacter sp. KY5 TaxID=2011159 RepID=UPI000DBF0073|nr:hypothetical protein [Erythrobacter sp. KY5]AWW73145.1 hypothetical protein CD351_01755 [Erythrobacter sp. KY5]
MQPELASGGFATRRADAPKLRRKRGAVTALILAPLAFASGALSLSNALVSSDPVAAKQLYPTHPQAKVRATDHELVQLPGIAASAAEQKGAENTASPFPSRLEIVSRYTQSRIEAQALSSLADTPYSSGALRQLALVSPSRTRQRALLDLSRSVSRRDIGAAALIAGLDFRDGRLRDGLETLDDALVISRSLDERIFPLLLSATRFEDFEPAFRPILERDPAWGERLAAHAIQHDASASPFARIARHFPQGSHALSIDYGAPLVDRLAGELDFEGAFDAYDAYSPEQQDPGRLADARLPPLDWHLIDRIDTGARLVGSLDPAIEFFAKAHRSGEAARIILRLDPGVHVLRFSFVDLRGGGGQLSLETVCIDKGGEWTSGTALAPIASSAAALAITVPSGCQYQSLRLAIAARGEAISVLIDKVTFERAANSHSSNGETL